MGGLVSDARVRITPRACLAWTPTRLVQVWVPDVRSEEFSAEAHRQSTAVAVIDRHGDDQDFIEAVSVGWDE